MGSRYGIFKSTYCNIWIFGFCRCNQMPTSGSRKMRPQFNNPLIATTGLLGEFDDAARYRFVGRQIAIDVVFAECEESAVYGWLEVSR